MIDPRIRELKERFEEIKENSQRILDITPFDAECHSARIVSVTDFEYAISEMVRIFPELKEDHHLVDRERFFRETEIDG